MARTTAKTLQETEDLLAALGARLRAARLRRGLSAKIVASRAGMSVMTLRAIERGSSGVTIGAYAAVLQTVGLEKSLAHVAEDDPLGRQLQDAGRKRAPRRRSGSTTINVPITHPGLTGEKPTTEVRQALDHDDHAAAGAGKEGADAVTAKGGVHSDDLLSLITGRRSA